MRTLTSITFLLVALGAKAQKQPVITIPFDSIANLYSYSEVVESEGLVDSTLYSNARAWLISKNGSAQFDEDVKPIKLIDKGTFSVQAKFSMGIASASSIIPITYTVVLEFKQNRYRYNIYRFRLYGDESSTTPTQALEDFVKRHDDGGMGRKANIRYEEDVCAAIDVEVNKLIQELKTQLVKKSTGDW